MFKGPLVLKNGELSPIHYSSNGVHADFKPLDGSDKMHIPYIGQTTLDMFRIGSKPSYDTYTKVSNLGLGSLDSDNAF